MVVRTLHISLVVALGISCRMMVARPVNIAPKMRSIHSLTSSCTLFKFFLVSNVSQAPQGASWESASFATTLRIISTVAIPSVHVTHTRDVTYPPFFDVHERHVRIIAQIAGAETCSIGAKCKSSDELVASQVLRAGESNSQLACSVSLQSAIVEMQFQRALEQHHFRNDSPEYPSRRW